ncbi:MAG TPA: hypothetical protein VGP93_09780, partial [Polyangiaceae bacterium]|nr:hypothetical protein [Polyangiaceae bacterium]
AAQIFQAGGGVIYVPGSYGTGGSGIFKSTDYGQTWNFMANGSVYTMVGTPTHLYAGGPFEGSLISAARSDDSAWAPITVPSGLRSGWKRGAVTFDGSHYILVTGNWTSGIWRYIEPQ